MKKRILTLFIVMLMLISITPYALASVNTYPMLPDGIYENWLITEYPSGDTIAHNYKYISQDSDGKYWANEIVRYTYYKGDWHKDFPAGASGLAIDYIVYDSLGIYATKSREIFGIIDFTSFEDYADGLKGQINVQNIVQIIVVGAGATVGLAFMWWGVRKLAKALFKAFKKGQVKI